MVASKFIYHILDLLIDADDSRYIAQQLNYIQESNIEYTSMGVFIDFTHTPEANNYLFKEKDLVLDGVTIESPEFEGEALAILHFTNGIINNLEIYAPSGNYISKEPSTYTIKQNFSIGLGRSVTV